MRDTELYIQANKMIFFSRMLCKKYFFYYYFFKSQKLSHFQSTQTNSRTAIKVAEIKFFSALMLDVSMS